MTARGQSRPHPLAHGLAGLTAGTVTTAALFPLDLIKVRFQVMDTATRRSLTSTVTSILRAEGARGLYQGLMPAIYGNAISWGGYFYLYEKAKERKRGWTSVTAVNLTSATEAGALMVALTNPIWLIKTRMQLQTSARATESTAARYRSFTHALLTIVREEGPLALYKGSIPALLLVSHGAVQFVVYEALKTKTARVDGDSDAASERSWVSAVPVAALNFANGAAAKLIASTSTYPFQVVKTRLQQRHAAGSVSTSAQYSGVVDCFRRMHAEEGLVGFFKGCIPNALRVAPAAALTFVVYEEVVKLTKYALPTSV